MLLVHELEFPLALSSESVMDALVADKPFVLDEVCSEPLLLGVSCLFYLPELLVEVGFYAVQLVLLVGAQPQLFLEKAPLVFQKVLALAIAS